MQTPGSRWSDALRSPWPTLVPVLLLLPFSLSGAVRYVLGLSLGPSLAITAMLFALLIAATVRWGVPQVVTIARLDTGVFLLLAAIALIVFTFRLWWTPQFNGMPNARLGVDVGNHLLLYYRFKLEPKQYEGFVGLYALMHWYRQLIDWSLSKPQSLYYALRFSHYAYLLSIPVSLALVVYPIVAPMKSRAAALSTVLASLPIQLTLYAYLIFTPVQYYQMDGFYSQVAGLYPIVLGWLCYGLVESAGQRFLICCAWVVIQRFTYGLNLGDTMFTLAFLWLWDAREIRLRWLRYGAFAFVPVALGASFVIFQKLWPLRVMPGYFLPQNIAWIVSAQLLLATSLSVAATVFTSFGIEVADASRRLWRYAAVFGFFNGLVTAAYFAYDQPHMYYILKYSLYAMVLCCVAMAGPLCTLAAQLVTGPKGWLLRAPNMQLAVGTAFIALLVFSGVVHGYILQRPLAIERYERPERGTELFSNFEAEVATFIEDVTQRRGKPFGGYYDPYWPRMFVHNSLYFLFGTHPDHHYNREFLASASMFADPPGRCYFAAATPDAYAAPAESPMGQQLRKFEAARSECTSFQPAWSDDYFRICAACY